MVFMRQKIIHIFLTFKVDVTFITYSSKYNRAIGS
ncbi:hypothetical protein BLJAPNOD_05478 [Ensifer sp. M14]|nr:hypothetical protein BLJAPNOD_05478 [Ensifer sp. M14]